MKQLTYRLAVLFTFLIFSLSFGAAAQTFRVENRPASPEQHRMLLAQINTLSQKNGVQTATLISIAEAIGVEFPDLGFDELTSRVSELARDAVELQKNLANLEAELASLRESADVVDARKAIAEAQTLFDQGNLTGAEAAFARITRESLARQDESRRAWLDAVDAQATIASLRQDFRGEAAIRRAARLQLTEIRRALDHEIWLQVMGEADALYIFGHMKGDNAALMEVIALFRDYALPLVLRESSPLDWAMTQNKFGNALWNLGQRESGTARLEEAVIAYRSALEEYTRDRVPLDWAMTQNNLGNALQVLGQRESGSERLEEAVSAYRNALEEYTRDRVPLQWATTQNNLGTTLQTLGQRESGTERLEHAVAAFEATLEEWTRDRVPLDWAAAQNNIGNALQVLGQRENGTDRLEEAVFVYRSALEERTRDRVPLQWATTQNNLGKALQTLGQRESGTERLEEAIIAYRSALEEYTRDRVPLDWAMTQGNLGNALWILGERESGTARLEEAVIAYRSALEEYTRDRVPLDWAMTQGNLAIVHYSLANKGKDPQGNLRLAIALCDEALEVYEAAGADYYIDLSRRNWAIFQRRLDALGN